MPNVSAHAEMQALLHTAGASPEIVMAFNAALADRPHLADWLNVPSAERNRFLSERREAGVRQHRAAGGPPAW